MCAHCGSPDFTWSESSGRGVLYTWTVIHQAMQKIQHMGFGRHAGLKRHFDGGQDIMLVMLQHQRQDLSHFPVSAALLEQMLLKQPEGFWHLGKRGAVA